MRSRFSSSTPVGCILGFFWILLAGLDALLLAVSYRAYHVDPPKTEIATRFLKYGIVLGVLLLLSLYIIFRLCVTSGKRVTDGSKAMTR
jgi:4-hydroxybenzoate polyprenyltransferase